MIQDKNINLKPQDRKKVGTCIQNYDIVFNHKKSREKIIVIKKRKKKIKI